MTVQASTAAQWEHPQYVATRPGVMRMRDSVAGEDVIKSKGVAYLPHPCTDPDEAGGPVQQGRYVAYKMFAEYENIPGNTLDTLVGAMFRIEPTLDVDSVDPALMTDADGNGAGLAQSIELTASECLQMRYHGLLAEFSDLAGEDPTEITVQAAKDRGLRSTIKHYPRESMVNWSFRVTDGAKQLNMVILCESDLQVFDAASVTDSGFSQNIVKAYLMLALDKDGEYYQRRYVASGKKGDEGKWSEEVYPLANGAKLRHIPFEIVYSSERQTGDVPKQLGYIDPISSKAVHRYQVSALLKESLRLTAQPTSWSKGWTDQSLRQYKEATGRDHVNLGAGEHIPLFGDAEVGYLQWDATSDPMFKYMDENKKQIVALGGVFTEESESASTATAACINSAEKKGVLSTLAKNIEESYRRVLGWCAEFNGTSADTVVVTLSREFVAIVLTALERGAILAELRENVITRAEALRQLERGGTLTKTAEEILNELETNGLL
jgi:hypothetical protein